MKRSLIPLSIGLILGSVSMLLWHLSAAASAEAAVIRESEERIAQLQVELAGARASADTWRLRMEAAGGDLEPVKENVLDIQRILNDARPLMKTLALMFGERRKEMTDRMIRDMTGKLAEQMGLTPEQTEAMVDHFTKLDAANFEKLKAMFDRKLTIFDVFTVMNDINPKKAMDAYVKQTMTPEQKASWENRKLETKAEQLERNANWKLDRMSRSLNLDETQKDQVFSILVKSNPEYDPSLSVEGVTGTPGAESSPLKEEEAIASVLHPEQLDEWNVFQEKQNAEKSRLTDALGGMDPGSFFRSLSGMGPMNGMGRQGRNSGQAP